MHTLLIITIIVSVCALFSYINTRFLKLHSTIGLLLIALVCSIIIILESKVDLGFYNFVSGALKDIDFSKTLLETMLCFMLFAGSIHVKLSDLKVQRFAVLSFATLGVALSTFLFGGIIYFTVLQFGYSVDFISCLLFGALVSPTDPIAVLSIIKGKVPPAIETTISGESLFNDGIGVVFFLTISQVIEKGVENLGALQVGLLFGQEVMGGILFGIIMGNLVYFFSKKIDHYQTEVLISLSMVMIINEVAHLLHVSGPLAVVVAGLIMGNKVSHTVMSEKTKDYHDKFWELIDEFLNAFLFVLIGFQLVIIPFTSNTILIGIIAIPVLLLCRWASIIIPTQFLRNKKLYNRKSAILLTWGGLRGGLSIAMALSIPDNPFKEVIVSATYVIVIFSIIVQGLTTEKLVKWLYR